MPRVDAVLYTHAHADHITGIDDVRILNRIAGRPLDAFATKATLDELTAAVRLRIPALAAAGLLPAGAGAAARSTAGETIEAAGMQVRLFEQDHGFIASLGLRIGEFRLFDRRREPGRGGASTALEGVDTWVVGCFLRHEAAQDARRS